MIKYGIVKKKNKSLAPFWRLNRSDFKLQSIPSRRGCIYEEALFYTVLMIKSDFWHFQALSNGQIWYTKKRKNKSLAPFWRFDIFWLQIAKHTPWGRSYGKKHCFILFWWLKVIFDTFRLFQMVKYGIVKKSKSPAPFWRFDRSDFKLQNIPPRGRSYGRKALFNTVLMIESNFWHFGAVSNSQIVKKNFQSRDS